MADQRQHLTFPEVLAEARAEMAKWPAEMREREMLRRELVREWEERSE